MSEGALVQQIGQASVSGGAGTSRNLTITLTQAVATGNLIVIVVYNNAGSSASSNANVSDNGPSYTYNVDEYAFDGNFRAFNVWIFSAIATSGMASGKVITVASNVDQAYASAAALEYAGSFVSSPVDQTHANAQNVSGSPITAATSGNTGTLGQPQELAIGAIGFVDPNVETETVTGSGGFTGRTIAQSGAAVQTGVIPLDQVVSATTALAATGTLGNAAQTMTVIATYKLLNFPPGPMQPIHVLHYN